MHRRIQTVAEYGPLLDWTGFILFDSCLNRQRVDDLPQDLRAVQRNRAEDELR